MSNWETGAGVPQDPNRPGQPVQWLIEQSEDQHSEGNAAARFFLDGRQDDGTIWIVRTFDAPANTPLVADLSFDVWSDSESFNTLAKVAAIASSHRPEEEEDFDTSEAANLVTGWMDYSYTFDVTGGSEGKGWVALGVSVVWEAEVTCYFDNVLVEIRPH